MSAEDLVYRKQIKEANELGNTLLAELMIEGVVESKRNNKVGSALKFLTEAVKIYESEISNLLSLSIGSCSEILELKEDKGNELKVTAAEKLLKKIEETLNVHVKHLAPNTISKQELESLDNQLKTIEAVKEKLSAQPQRRELEGHLNTIHNIQSKLGKIKQSLMSSQLKVGQMQQKVFEEAADVTYFAS